MTKIYLARASIDSYRAYSVGTYSSLSKAKDALRAYTNKENIKWIVEQDLDPIDIDDNGEVVWSVDANEVF